MKNVFCYWVPVLMYMAVISYLSSLSSPEDQLPSFFFPFNDKVLHAIEYAILGVLCFRAFENAGGALGNRHTFALSLFVSTAFGLSDEFHQSFVPLRQADHWDLLADCMGAMAGILFWQWLRARFPEPVKSH